MCTAHHLMCTAHHLMCTAGLGAAHHHPRPLSEGAHWPAGEHTAATAQIPVPGSISNALHYKKLHYMLHSTRSENPNQEPTGGSLGTCPMPDNTLRIVCIVCNGSTSTPSTWPWQHLLMFI
jgi:hypothetical protein